MNKLKKSLVWFRRDLRLYDHVALYHALKSSDQVYCSFIFDTNIIDKLEDKEDRSPKKKSTPEVKVDKKAVAQTVHDDQQEIKQNKKNQHHGKLI